MKKIISLFMACLVSFGLFGCSTNTKTEEETTIEASVKTVSTGDIEMDYVTFGSGKKSFVILPGLSIHSVMSQADAVAQNYADFTEDYTVYLFDRVKDMKEDYTIRDMANDTASAMEKLGISDADVFGASQGGMIAQYLAIDHPKLVNKLILGSTLSKPNDTFNSVVNHWISLAEAKDEEGLLESFCEDVYSQATLDAYKDTLIESNKGISDEEWTRFLIQAKACQNFNCYDELSAITCPVLVLGSQGDKVVTASGSEEISDVLKCDLYLYNDEYGHGVYDEASDYKTRCLDFLNE